MRRFILFIKINNDKTKYLGSDLSDIVLILLKYNVYIGYKPILTVGYQFDVDLKKNTFLEIKTIINF